ncbi:uncharacterized protein LOC144338533 [Macaca mulatta]
MSGFDWDWGFFSISGEGRKGWKPLPPTTVRAWVSSLGVAERAPVPPTGPFPPRRPRQRRRLAKGPADRQARARGASSILFWSPGGARSNGVSRKGRRPRDRGVTRRVVGDRLGIPGRLPGVSGKVPSRLGLLSSLHRLLVSSCAGRTVGLQRRKRLKFRSSRMSLPVTRRPREQTPHPDIVAGTSGLFSKVAALFSLLTGQENI